MPVLIGVDEAGYGPNYGPLCVAATAWRVDELSESPDLYKLLRKAVVRSPDKSGKKLAIADSKALYKAGFGVHLLERGVLAALASLSAAADDGSETLPVNTRGCVERVAELLRATAADPQEQRRGLSCHFDDEQALPLEGVAEEICGLSAKLRQVCEEAGARLLAIRARLVYPAEFNELVEYYGTKGAALSHVTLALVRQVVDGVTRAGGGDAPARLESSDRFLICLDKHGGRNRYAALLQHHFPESWIESVSEGRSSSRYRWIHGETPMEAVFRVGCEELLPTALASMTAKYHREVAMRAFNAFWTSRLPELRPTAGYPGDAQRFKADIASLQQELGIEDRLLWRCR